MSIVRIVLIGLAVGFAAMIAWAATSADLSASWRAVIADPWGLVMIVDLYFGFALIAAVIWLVERNRLIALAFIIPMLGLGNLVPALWMAWRVGQWLPALRAAQSSDEQAQTAN